ncbi:MAG: transketolase [Prevotellaceae bacterium]|nr:transketolase [Prevotellaceae bacterium]
MPHIQQLQKIASQVRRDIIRMVTGAQSGHPGGSLSSTDFLTALFFHVLDHDPKRWTPEGKDVDMFFLSIGHISPAYYSILARSGYFDCAELSTFRKLGSRLQGHPSTEKGLPGVHVATGSLGQGLSVAIGAALAKKRNGDPHYVYALVGDGECGEGQIWEAALFAAHHQVDNLIVLTDWNGQQIDGKVDDVCGLGDLERLWKSFCWETIVVPGHDMLAILDGFDKAKAMSNKGKPVMMLMKTQMGRGVDFMCGTNEWHGKATNKEQAVRALSQLEETLGDY